VDDLAVLEEGQMGLSFFVLPESVWLQTCVLSWTDSYVREIIERCVILHCKLCVCCVILEIDRIDHYSTDGVMIDQWHLIIIKDTHHEN